MRSEQAAGRAALTIRQRVSISYDFPVIFTRDAFSPENPALGSVFPSPPQGSSNQAKAALVVDQGAAEAFPDLCERAASYFETRPETPRLIGDPLVLPGGERAKADQDVLQRVLRLVFERGVCRHSFLIVLGGGALLDAAGFAAATAHRGVRLVRMPSTTLAQNDAGVGLKNGVSLFGRKNFWGAFAPPFAVVNDLALLSGLAPRDRRAGLSEAVKVALIRNRDFFERLYAARHELGTLAPWAVEEAVMDCARLHMTHIATAGDPFELGSARPLDFGHWSAHALEEITRGGLRHGEAVAIGIALDSLYSSLTGLLSREDCARILTLLRDMGFNLWNEALESLDVAAALDAFREHLGGELTISLLQGIGRGLEVNAIDPATMREAKALLREDACAR